MDILQNFIKYIFCWEWEESWTKNNFDFNFEILYVKFKSIYYPI